jgi:hypothetical protein
MAFAKGKFMSDLDLDELLKTFENVTREEHMNPTGVGCLERPQLLELAGAPANGASIDEETLKHLTVCWPCLQKLKALRAQSRAAKRGQSE